MHARAEPDNHSANVLRCFIVISAIVVVMIVLLRLEGRVWWCERGEYWRLWIGNVWTPHCSQHLLDPYSITHISHGLIFYSVLAIFCRRLSIGWRLAIALGIAAGWEVLENSPMVIDRYRTATMSLDYLGDSIVKSLGDVGCCAAGFFIARALGLWKTAIVFLASEILLVILIRDSLILSTFMLIAPVDAIKHWQTAGNV
jgi:hypothetical protein